MTYSKSLKVKKAATITIAGLSILTQILAGAASGIKKQRECGSRNQEKRSFSPLQTHGKSSLKNPEKTECHFSYFDI